MFGSGTRNPGSVKTYHGSGSGQEAPGPGSVTLLQSCRTSGMKGAAFTSQKYAAKKE
jgi:hypothetical protein